MIFRWHFHRALATDIANLPEGMLVRCPQERSITYVPGVNVTEEMEIVPTSARTDTKQWPNDDLFGDSGANY